MKMEYDDPRSRELPGFRTARTTTSSPELQKPTLPWPAALLGLASVAGGAVLAALVLPAWLPNLSASIMGPDPKVFWYLSRGSAILALALLWFSMACGLLISNQLARIWPGGPVAFDLHQYTSLLGLGFSLFHALILLGDRYIDYSLAQIALPFASLNYRPFWVGLGQLGFYLAALLVGSFYVRRQIGQRSWRLIHYASYFMFILAWGHGIASGTDSQAAWVVSLNWFYGTSLLFLLVYRVLTARRGASGGKVEAKQAGVAALGFSTPSHSGRNGKLLPRK
jgi:predicted ferric reductase